MSYRICDCASGAFIQGKPSRKPGLAMHALRLIGGGHFAVLSAPNRNVAGHAVHDLDLEVLLVSYGACDFETSMGEGEEGEYENDEGAQVEAHNGGGIYACE